MFWRVLVITRYHDSFEGCHSVGILPTDLPELSKPKFQRSNCNKTKILGVKNMKFEISSLLHLDFTFQSFPAASREDVSRRI